MARGYGYDIYAFLPIKYAFHSGLIMPKAIKIHCDVYETSIIYGCGDCLII